MMVIVTKRGDIGGGVFRREANKFGYIHVEFGILVNIDAMVRRKQRG